TKVINRGDVFKLNVDIAKTASDKRVVWFSSNPKVVSVDDKGNVKGLNVGKALVVVQAIYGDVYDICEVEVKKQEEVVKEVPITSIKLNKTALDLRVGNKYKLVATIQPVNATNKNLVWVSSNPKVVSVDGKGNVVAKGKGKAIITVRNVKGDKKAICNVTVR
ncbi:MAG: Ig-like domain-containing protein, partial [Candidatus Anstonellales archaeon]